MMAESAGAKSPRAVTACQLSLSLNTCTRVRSGMTSFAEEAYAITPMLPAARRAAVRALVARIIRFIHQIHADMQPGRIGDVAALGQYERQKMSFFPDRVSFLAC